MTDSEGLLRRGKYLEYATLGWNVVGVAVLLVAAPRAHSVALVAFGLDTLLEIGASTIVLWELNGTGGTRQRKGLQLLSVAFLGLGLYLLGQSGWSLWHRQHPLPSPLGLAWLVLTFAVMLALAGGKHRVGKQLNNPVLLTEGRVTLVDAALAGVVLLSMGLTRVLGWWWADAAGGLVLMAYCFWEARHAWGEAQHASASH
ncbi:cation transporter [Hymenobacter rubidus]|uniref:cation transporter n=1 Tax=Hymenobacter rubidus TaxID=1441626 RepID=UPI00191D779D|nr:cation transporter [Hymenobacter rubidus]